MPRTFRQIPPSVPKPQPQPSNGAIPNSLPPPGGQMMIVNTRTGMMRPVQIAATQLDPENLQISKEMKPKEPTQFRS